MKKKHKLKLKKSNQNKQYDWRKIVFLAGAILPVYFFLTSCLLGKTWPGYNPLTDYISYLASVSSPVRIPSIILLFLMKGLIISLAGLALRSVLKDSIVSRIIMLSLIISGLAYLLVGIFPTDIVGDKSTPSGQIHLMAAMIPVYLLPIAAVLTAWVVDKKTRIGRWMACVSPILGLSPILITIIFDLAIDKNTYLGLHQRLGMLPLLLYIGLISFYALTKIRSKN